MRRAPSLRMIFVALVVSLAGPFHFGYQLLITNPAQRAFIRFFNDTLDSELHITASDSTLDKIWSFIVAVLFLGALVGSFSIRLIADKIGRKRGLYLSLGIGVVSATASLANKIFFFTFQIPSVLLYSCSRITVGYSTSLSLGLSALFLSESSPKECRGSIGMIIGMCVQLGILTGSILAMPQIFGTVQLWHMIYVAEIVMMITFLTFLPLLPETPGYLVQRGVLEAAKKSLMFYFNCNDEAAEVHLIHIKEEQKLLEDSHTMVDVMKAASLRRKTFVGIVVILAMSFSGITVINAYAVELLRSTGLTSLQASLANVAAVVSSMVVDKFGRRPLLLIAFSGCLICNVLIFSLLLYKVLGWILIAIVCLFTVFVAIGPGPLCYFITAELVGQSARSGAQSWASVAQMLSRFLTVIMFLPMKNSLGESWSYLLLFVLPIIVAIIFLYYHLPETKCRTAYEVSTCLFFKIFSYLSFKYHRSRSLFLHQSREYTDTQILGQTL
ncbi:unnamed protein product [Angiostrongylus costaricensis]|uniref:MFS domain-containing protein n=1 Tax=Angiostrongylus costaricensis TaxID=334426 RepID=A0A158PG65_ANGCS|nr:unnamed protein product [Angiostrongylus costaricensis]